MFKLLPPIRKGILALLMMGAVWAGIPLNAQSDFTIGSIIRGFELPQSDREGNIKSKIRGEQAVVISENKIQITGLVIDLFSGESVTTRITSPQCTFWQMENKLTTDQNIEVRRKGMLIRAKGMEWEMNNSEGIFHNQVRVVVEPGAIELEP